MTKKITDNVRRWEPRGRCVPEAGELVAMREGLGDLLHVLSWARPHGSQAELDFLKGWLLPELRALGADPEIDGFGNIWVKVSKPFNAGPDFLWSCHVDTVHAKGGRQAVRFAADDGRTIELVKPKAGRCLGADDGAGLWLLLQMIRAGVPGGYVFHRGEEKGRLGSEYVANNEAHRLRGYDACVAFDRRGTSDLITHQMGLRCASEAFADTFAAAINKASRGLRYVADDTGSYTDSYSYAELISECANVSVGYEHEHGPRETLDGLHLWRLREAICNAALSTVVCERDPADMDYGWSYGYGSQGGWTDSYRGGVQSGGSRTGAAAWGGNYRDDDRWQDDDGGEDFEGERLLDLIRRYPSYIADLLISYGLTADDVLDTMPGSIAAFEAGRRRA